MHNLLVAVDKVRRSPRGVKIDSVQEIDARTCSLRVLLPEPDDLTSRDCYWTGEPTDLMAEWHDGGATLSLSTVVPLVPQPRYVTTTDWIWNSLLEHRKSWDGVHISFDLGRVGGRVALRCWMERSAGENGGEVGAIRNLLQTMLPIFCTESHDFALLVNAPRNYIPRSGGKA